MDTLWVCKQNTLVLVLQGNKNCEATTFSFLEKISDCCDHRIRKLHKTIFIQLSHQALGYLSVPN